MAEEEKEDEARPPGLCCAWGEDCGRGRWGEEGGRELSLSPWLLVGGVGGSWRVSSKEEATVDWLLLLALTRAFSREKTCNLAICVGGWLVCIYHWAGYGTVRSLWVHLLLTPASLHPIETGAAVRQRKGSEVSQCPLAHADRVSPWYGFPWGGGA